MADSWQNIIGYDVTMDWDNLDKLDYLSCYLEAMYRATNERLAASNLPSDEFYQHIVPYRKYVKMYNIFWLIDSIHHNIDLLINKDGYPHRQVAINHTTHSDWDGVAAFDFWTEETLLDAIDEDERIIITKLSSSEEIIKWLKQHYKILNLLRKFSYVHLDVGQGFKPFWMQNDGGITQRKKIAIYGVDTWAHCVDQFRGSIWSIVPQLNQPDIYSSSAIGGYDKVASVPSGIAISWENSPNFDFMNFSLSGYLTAFTNIQSSIPEIPFVDPLKNLMFTSGRVSTYFLGDILYKSRIFNHQQLAVRDMPDPSGLVGDYYRLDMDNGRYEIVIHGDESFVFKDW